MWRSVLGAVLARRAPKTYDALYRPDPPANFGKRFGKPPPPFIVDAPFPPQVVLLPGDPLDLSLTLIGSPTVHVETVITALDEAAQTGLGKGRAIMRRTTRQPRTAKIHSPKPQ